MIDFTSLLSALESYAIYIVLVIALLLSSVLLIRYFLRRANTSSRDSSIEYTAALNYLLNGEKQEALEKFKETVKKDTGNINAYIRIGDILRDQGEYLRAIKIHRSLMIRNDMNKLERIEILKSLFKDYRDAGRFNSALKASEELLEMTRNQDWVKRDQLELYEEMEDWDKAFDLRKKISSANNSQDQNRLMALYKVEAGLKLTRRDSEHDGRLKFREAIKTDKNCAPAFLYLSDSYIRENRLTDALTELRRFISNVPNLAYLAFDRLKDILYQKGNFGEIESIYQSLLKSNPELDEAWFALADLYERKGDMRGAIDSCKRVLETKPDSVLAKQYLVNYYAKTNEIDDALRIALDLIDTSLSEEKKFVCEICGFNSNKPYWHCPQCKAWNSYVS